eukprot:390597-Pelagomonas_calceolata.AAC.1
MARLVEDRRNQEREAGKKTQARPTKKGKRGGAKNVQGQGQRGGRQTSRHGPKLTGRTVPTGPAFTALLP